MPSIFPDYFRYRPVRRQKQQSSADDLRTWPSSGSFTTIPLPAEESTTPYFLVFEITRKLPAGAISDTYGLRITGKNGVHLAHLRTQANRIFVGGMFAPGEAIPITYYWGKTGQSQPGTGFPAASTILAPFRLFCIFEGGAIKDLSPDPATFTVVGTPTFQTGLNGQAMQCGPGSYVQTTATKLRGNARNARYAMALIYTPQTDSSARTICWANWTTNQRAFQLWGDTSYVELYVDDDGQLPYQRWVNRSTFSSGWSWIGCSWVAESAYAIVQRDQNVQVLGEDLPDTPTQGALFNSNSPYVIGGTPVSGSYHAGMVEAAIEFNVDSKNPTLFLLTPTGAGATTAGYDNLPPGVTSSEQMAEMDILKVSAFADRFSIAGQRYGIPPAVLAAIASRETRGGSGLDANGYGDSGNAVGIMQIDINWHTPVAIGDDFGSQGHIDQATGLIAGWMAEARTAYPAWSDQVILQAGVAAYNGGPEVFSDGPGNFDATTDGGDYSNDVLARAQYYAEHMSAFFNSQVAPMRAFDLAWRTNEQFLGIDRTPDTFQTPSAVNQELSVEVSYPKVLVTGISAGTPIYVSGGRSPAYAISSSVTAGDDVSARGTTPGTISSGQYVRVWDTMSGLYSDSTRTDLTIGTSTFTYVGTTKAAPGTAGGTGIPTGAATYTVSSLAAGQSVINNQLSPGQILEFTAGDYRGQGTLTISNKDWSAGAKAVIRASTFGYRGPHPNDGGLFVSGEGAFTTGSGGAEFSGMNFANSKNFVVEGLRLWLGQGYQTAAYQFISYVQNAVFKNCRFAGYKPSGYPSLWVTNAVGNTWVADKVPKGVSIKEASGCVFEKCLFQYFLMSCYIIGGNSTYQECVWTDSGGDHVMMSFANSGQKMIKCVWGRIFSPNSDVHADNLQCTTKTTNNADNQTYELCLIGPLNSGDPHTQGPFFDQDGSAYIGPKNVIFKDTLIESRVTNAFYAAYAENCQVQNLTILQNQFSGINSSNVDTLIHTPVLNFNPSAGPSRGGNIINRTAYVSYAKGASDAITNSYQLLPAAYAAQITDYPLYPGTFRPVMFLNDYGCIDAAELERMAPKTTSAIHPNQADIGAHRLFTHYGALP